MSWYPTLLDQAGSSVVYVLVQAIVVVPVMMVVRRLVRGAW